MCCLRCVIKVKIYDYANHIQKKNNLLFSGVFGGRGRGIQGAGRGQPQDKKPGKPQGIKNQH